MIKSIKLKKEKSCYKGETILDTNNKNVVLIYGLNGTGKSTIASYLHSFPECSNFSDCSINPNLDMQIEEILVYNKQFIEETFYTENNIKGIFTLSKENKEAKTKIDSANKFLEQLYRQQKEAEEKRKKEDERNILNSMGIFLSIFSVIGLGVSSILKLESNHVATWLMICGTILITMTGLFTLIDKKIEIMKIMVIIIGLVLFGAGRFIRCVFTEENKELVKQEDFKLVKDDINNIKNIIILSSEGYIRYTDFEENKNRVFAVLKYISADDIIREIVNIYKPDKEEAWIKIAGKQSRVIGLYSPIHRCGKTYAAVALSAIGSEYKKTLLISFEEYKGILYELLESNDYDMSDVLYAYKQGNFSWDKLSKIVYTTGSLNLIAPARYPEDISELSSKEIYELIQSIARESEYELIVIDFGVLGKRGIDILEMCHSVYMPILQDPISEKRIEEFYDYLNLLDREHIKDKILSCVLPSCNYNELEVDKIAYSELGEYMRAMAQSDIRQEI